MTAELGNVVLEAVRAEELYVTQSWGTLTLEGCSWHAAEIEMTWAA